MNILGFEIKRKSPRLQIFPEITQVNRNVAVYPSYNISNQTTRYSTSDDIYSIIRKLSTTAAMVPLYGYEVTEEKAFKQLKKLKQPHSNVFKTKQLQLKALEDLPETDKVAELLERPHHTMSKFEFFEAAYSFLFLHGECLMLKEIPEFGVNAGRVTKLHFMNPENVVLHVTQDYPFTVTGYDYIVNGTKVRENIPPDEVIHIKYFNPDYGINGSELRGLSPLKALAKRMVRLDSNMDNSVAQLQNGGVPGIVYDKAFADEKAIEVTGQRKENFYRYLSNSSNKGAPYFATGEMGYLPLGLKLADLETTELAKIDFKKLCNAFGVSDVLFNNDAASTESNVEIHTKGLYTNTVLPNVYRMRDALITGILPYYSDNRTVTSVNAEGDMVTTTIKGDGKKRDIREDLSEIAELQGDMQKMANVFAALPVFVPNEVREAFNYDRDPDPDMDKVYIKQGYQLLEDLNAIPVLPNDANDYV